MKITMSAAMGSMATAVTKMAGSHMVRNSGKVMATQFRAKIRSKVPEPLKAVARPNQLEGMGRFAVLKDPQGAVFQIIAYSGG
jgi:predicted enzyme related to lactoylglutathione lyase